MNDRLRVKLVVLVFAIIIGGFFILDRIVEPPAILFSERRAPSRVPAVSFRSIASAEVMDRFEGYAADAFPFRESFRTLRSAAVFGLFFQSDKNGVYMDGGGAGEFKALDPVSVGLLSEKIVKVADLLRGVDIYYSFVPDKSVYSGKTMPGFDASLARDLLTNAPSMGGFTFIDLTDALDAGSYYKTDHHWDQLKLSGVLGALSSKMGFKSDTGEYTEVYAGEFQGVYSGQLALPTEKDSLGYLDCPSLSALYLNMGTMVMEPAPVYDIEKFSGLDAYDIFLSGAQPMVIVENGAADTDKELYLFRDSFSSSLAPLLANSYSKVFLIDLRYMDMRTLRQLVDFKQGSDALFLYSSLVLNNADMLLVG